MYTDLSEIWDVTLINPNLLCHKQNKTKVNGKQTNEGRGEESEKEQNIMDHYLMQ